MNMSERSACTCVAAALILIAAVSTTQTTVQVRFHHLHYQAPDVSAALAATVRQQGGSRVLLQGLGVGVRLDRHYVLFDTRPAIVEDSAPEIDRRSPDVAQRYRDAVHWLAGHGVEVTPQDFNFVQSPAPLADEVLDHIAFAAGDPDMAVKALRASGATEARRTADSAFFRANDSLIEVVRDTDLPDVLWCPMHPDVRAASPGKCPICSMDLVPIPPPRIGQYRVVVTQQTAPKGRGASALTLQIRDPQTGEPVTTLATIHERTLHLFIISRDLRFFAHEHPVQEGDRFHLPIDLAPGHFMLVADFVPAGGSPQMVHRALVTPGYALSPFALPVEVSEDVAEKTTDGVRVRLSSEPRPGRLEAILRFTFTDATSGAPVRELQPYLGASGHLLLVSTDLTHAIHAHPEGLSLGPEVTFGAEFPTVGLYKMWVQVQRHGKVVTAPFVLRVG